MNLKTKISKHVKKSNIKKQITLVIKENESDKSWKRRFFNEYA